MSVVEPHARYAELFNKLKRNGHAALKRNVKICTIQCYVNLLNDQKCRVMVEKTPKSQRNAACKMLTFVDKFSRFQHWDFTIMVGKRHR